MPDSTAASAQPELQITNCHLHTFTQAHTPDRFLPWPVTELARLPPMRSLLNWAAHVFDPERKTKLGRYAQIVDTSYKKDQSEVFDIVRGFYPERTRFVILPMDMTQMNAGRVRVGIDEQHAQIAELRDSHPDAVIPFAAVDPRHENVVEKTIALIEQKGFRGLKLYPPTGYHPFDHRLWPLYEYAERHGLPVMTHCSRPAQVQFRGAPTPDMRVDPVTGEVLDLGRFELLTRFTDPDAYVPLLEKYPKLRVCLAHFGGDGDWGSYLDHPWHSGMDAAKKSWLAKIVDMLKSDDYPNLWTDVSYTLFAKDENVYLLKVLLCNPRISSRVLFGSDFYVVENAELEERRRSVRLRALLGDDLFKTIAQDNAREYLGPAAGGAEVGVGAPGFEPGTSSPPD